MLNPKLLTFIALQCLRVAAKAQGAGYKSTGEGMKEIPTTAQKIAVTDTEVLEVEPPNTTDLPDPMYGPRNFDLPFYRLYGGNLKYFPAGELNTPTGNGDVWGKEYDNVNQSACGIPDNAFFISKVAIHPYFLKFADLSRYCQQDVCISFWKEDGSSDMMLKVTDICSTDPNDPTHCATPADIKIDRTKARIWDSVPNPEDPRVSGDQFPDKIWWFFMKCWDDGLVQPAYKGNNWFSTPAIPNNLQWAQGSAMQQYLNNQKSYAAYDIPTYPNGGYNPVRDSTTSPPITDWVPGQEPSWEPLAGGVGWGKQKSPSEKEAVDVKKPAASPKATESTKKAKEADYESTTHKSSTHHHTSTKEAESTTHKSSTHEHSSTREHESTTHESSTHHHTSTKEAESKATSTDTCTETPTSSHHRSSTHHHSSTDSKYKKEKDVKTSSPAAYGASTGSSSTDSPSSTAAAAASSSTMAAAASSSTVDYAVPSGTTAVASSSTIDYAAPSSTVAAAASSSTSLVPVTPITGAPISVGIPSSVPTDSACGAVTITITKTFTFTSTNPPSAASSSSSSVAALPAYSSSTSTALAAATSTAAAAASSSTTCTTLSTIATAQQPSSPTTTAHTPISTAEKKHDVKSSHSSHKSEEKTHSSHSSHSTHSSHSSHSTHKTETSHTHTHTSTHEHKSTSTMEVEAYKATVSAKAKVAATTTACTKKRHLARHKRRAPIVDVES